MPTRSIHLSDADAEGLEQLHAATGKTEDVLLEQAVLRGLQALRIEEGIRAFKSGLGSSEAAVIAGLPRAVFLHEMAERGVTILDGPSTLAEELAALAQDLGNTRLAAVARKLAAEKQ
jgi:hypothetical protein